MVDNTKKTGKIYSFSYIRAIACIAIIILHTVYSAVLMYGTELTKAQYAVSMAIVDNMMWAVPCFVMVTGALLLNPEKDLSYEKLLKKYILRIVGALAIFGLLFRLCDMIMNGEAISIRIIFDGLYKIFTGTGWSHMWYLYLLIGLYLLMPFYKKIVKYSSEKELWYLLAIYVLFLSLLPFLKHGISIADFIFTYQQYIHFICLPDICSMNTGIILKDGWR